MPESGLTGSPAERNLVGSNPTLVSMHKTEVLSEEEILRILESCDEAIIEQVLGEEYTEVTGAVRAAHGGELVLQYKQS